MRKFIGRQKELDQLNDLTRKKTSSLVVVKGRRRIGKSRLIQEFYKNKQSLNFIGLPPTKKTTAQDQRKEFAWQLNQQTGLKVEGSKDWNDLFLKVFEYAKDKKIIIVFDEISWMGSKDKNFLGKLKTAWDNFFSPNPNLILILCGSISSWIEKNILSSTGFVGRVSLVLTVKELSLRECSEFWENTITSPYEIFKIISIIGGVPKYLEEIDIGKSAENNIARLCFRESGFLFNEFENIFSDLFSTRTPLYRQILKCIVDSRLDMVSIFRKLEINKAGFYTKYFLDLEKAGFITRDHTWHLATGKRSKLSHYRISDNYTRFYLKYINPSQEIIGSGAYEFQSLSDFPGWSSIMGLQFENLVLNNRRVIIEKLGINPSEIIYDNPYFQLAKSRKKGCQIDYMIQTKFNTLYLCEIKFSKQPVGVNVVEDILDKIESLDLPKRTSVKPVLIHVNGITEDLDDKKFFANIIDFGDLCFN